ncbi:natural killer cell receptor 2B4-like isoform X2 [Triplophysa dalaica]|nr:natural killer cell receptor 2B4-like isoform X2 [Triplophysa dalaica]
MEGHSVTLHKNDTQLKSAHLIRWTFVSQESPIVRINKEANKVLIFDDIHDGRFRDRLQVDVQTGSLTITNTKTEDSGLYEITISGKQQISYRFNINVYAHLPVPVISSDFSQCSSSSSSVSNCSVLCSVLNVPHVSLSWYKGKSLLSNISVSDLNIRLSLPLEVEYQDTNTYRCVINNPIANHPQHLNINHVCQPCSGLTFIHKVVMCCAAVASLKIVTVLLIICVCRKHRVNER